MATVCHIGRPRPRGGGGPGLRGGRVPPGKQGARTMLVKAVDGALGQSIQQNDWMSPATTKAQAQDKLGAIEDKIGYPGTWRDYSALTIDRTSLVQNVARLGRVRAAAAAVEDGAAGGPAEWIDDPADGERLLRPAVEHDQLSRRHPPASVLRSAQWATRSTSAPSGWSSATRSSTASTTRAASSTRRGTSATGGRPRTRKSLRGARQVHLGRVHPGDPRPRREAERAAHPGRGHRGQRRHSPGARRAWRAPSPRTEVPWRRRDPTG